MLGREVRDGINPISAGWPAKEVMAAEAFPPLTTGLANLNQLRERDAETIPLSSATISHAAIDGRVKLTEECRDIRPTITGDAHIQLTRLVTGRHSNISFP